MKHSQLNFEEFIAGFPADVKENAILARELILQMFGQAEEVIDPQEKIVRYTFGSGYKDTLCALIPSLKSLKIGFNYGSMINDPECMLAGSGKVHRYILIRDFYAQQSYTKYLLKEAFKLWKLQ